MSCIELLRERKESIILLENIYKGRYTQAILEKSYTSNLINFTDCEIIIIVAYKITVSTKLIKLSITR